MKITDIEKVKKAIEKGEYRKKVLAELMGTTVATFRSWLKRHPNIETLRVEKQPRIAEKGRKDYVTRYNQNYEREVTPEREAWMKEWNKKRYAKIKAKKEAEKLTAKQAELTIEIVDGLRQIVLPL